MSSNSMLIGRRLEIWWGSGSWYRPIEWVFEFGSGCSNKCIILELGFFGLTWLRNDCVRNSEIE
jgi:hypothetical protein